MEGKAPSLFSSFSDMMVQEYIRVHVWWVCFVLVFVDLLLLLLLSVVVLLLLLYPIVLSLSSQASLPDNFKALPDFVPVFQAARDFEARVLTTCGVSRGTTGVVASFVDDVSNRFAYACPALH